MEILTLASSYKNMHRLSTAMCSMVAMPNPEGVTRVKANIGYWVANQVAIVNEKTTLAPSRRSGNTHQKIVLLR